jgi:hypothetical protein
MGGSPWVKCLSLVLLEEEHSMPFINEYYGFYPDENGPFGVLRVD